MGKDKLKEAIYVIVETAQERLRKNLCRTEIVKLLYIAEIVAHKTLGRSVTGAEFTYHYFGPFSKEVLDALKELTASGHLRYITKGWVWAKTSVYRYATGNEWPMQKINGWERLLLERITEEYGRLDIEALIDLTYMTEPMMGAKMGEKLRFK